MTTKEPDDLISLPWIPEIIAAGSNNQHLKAAIEFVDLLYRDGAISLKEDDWSKMEKLARAKKAP